MVFKSYLNHLYSGRRYSDFFIKTDISYLYQSCFYSVHITQATQQYVEPKNYDYKKYLRSRLGRVSTLMHIIQFKERKHLSKVEKRY